MYDEPKHLHDHVIKLRLNETTYKFVVALADLNGRQKSVQARELLLQGIEALLASITLASARAEGPNEGLMNNNENAMHLHLSEAQMERLRELAEELGVSIDDAVSLAVERAVDTYKDKKRPAARVVRLPKGKRL